MKRFLLTILLITFALATAPTAQQCECPDPSFPVNKPVVINTPTTIAPPACAIPNIQVPVVCPPDVNTPTINTPVIQACTLNAPCVIAPPTVTPPTVVVPVVKPPYIPLPPLPPQVPSPNCPPPKPTGPIIAPPTPVCKACNNDQLSNIFTLSFQYACRQTIAFNSCQGNVIWNNVEILTIVPTDYNIRTVTINVTAVAGQNFLQFQGAGVSDSFGLTIDNVQLVRFGTSQNIVINGDFSAPNQFGSWSIQNNIPGWVGQGIEIGWGQIYNNQWNSQVCELDGNINFQITQYFTFNAQFNLVNNNQAPTGAFNGQTLTYKLEFDYAARFYGASGAATSQANVLWNNFVIASIVSADFAVYHFSQQVQLIPGNNLLAFDAAGISDSYGLAIANVKLTSAYDSTNLILNGNFVGSGLGSANWNYFSNGFQGWYAKLAEVGYCKTTYNPNWANNAQLCIELDSDSNQRYLQTITISQKLFSSLLINIQTQTGNQNAQNNLACAANNAQQNLNSAIAVIQGQILCQVNFQVNAFNNYLNSLYQCSNQSVKNLHDNAIIALNQFDYTLQAYTYSFGCSDELDFDYDYFAGHNQGSWNGHIVSINGKVIKCHDGNGNYHHIQIAPCTHFEGQFPLPRIGDKIFWQGVQDKCGRTYVSVATTCNC